MQGQSFVPSALEGGERGAKSLTVLTDNQCQQWSLNACWSNPSLQLGGLRVPARDAHHCPLQHILKCLGTKWRSPAAAAHSGKYS